jgi:uncharacterized protein
LLRVTPISLEVRGTSVAALPIRNAETCTPGYGGGQWERNWQEVSVAKEDRGFASMDRAKQKEIASKGGKAAHAKGTAHEWTSEEAREAGRKGGMASHRRRKQMMEGEGGPGSESGGENMTGGGESRNEQIQ